MSDQSQDVGKTLLQGRFAAQHGRGERNNCLTADINKHPLCLRAEGTVISVHESGEELGHRVFAGDLQPGRGADPALHRAGELGDVLRDLLWVDHQHDQRVWRCAYARARPSLGVDY